MAVPKLFEFLESEELEYVIAMAKNPVLERRAARLMPQARRLSRKTQATAHVYGECRYAAGSWAHRRRIIIKAEVVRHPGRDPKDNPRFVVTNMKTPPQKLYEDIYCARAQVTTLRERLLKLGVWVQTSVRRIVLHLPASFPHHRDWQRIAHALGAALA